MPQDLQPHVPLSIVRPSHPVGTIILAALFYLVGFCLVMIRTLSLVRAYTMADEVTFHPSYFIDRTTDFVTAATAIIAASGLLLNRRWGWWLSLFHCYWQIAIQSIFPMIHFGIAMAAHDPYMMPRREFSSALFASLFFGLPVLYLMQQKVMSYYSVDVAERWRATGIVIGISLPLAAGLYLLSLALQRHVSALPPELNW